MEVPRAHAWERWGSKEGVDRWQADLVLELREERSLEQELLEQAHVAQSEEGESALFMVSAYVPNFDSKSTEVEVIDDDVELEDELQLGVAKAAPAGDPIQLKEERVLDQISERDEQHEHR